MPGGIVSLESVEINNGKHDIVFQSNEVYLDNVVINCKTLRFTAAVKYIKTSKTVTIVCDNLEFENSGSALVFEKIVHKPDSKLIIKYKRVYSNNRKLQFDIQNTDSIVYSSN
tara:strand:+ start:187 stop:525 length:339 start_codon:yes stop_codon:yes gene_type:complete